MALGHSELYGFQLFKGPHKLALAPQWYHLKRVKDGGTKQTGDMYGLRVGYERRRADALYWAVDGYYARGTLKGRSGGGSTLKSKKTDSEVEGRLGYTWRCPWCWQPCFTPFIGGGYFRGVNKFESPSPLPIRFRNTFSYFSTGLLSRVSLGRCFDIGINFSAKFMLDGRSKVSNDPLFDDFTTLVENKTYYVVEVPIAYRFVVCGRSLEAYATPFYRLRHYGGRENFPFDYIDTKFSLVGLEMALSLCF